MVCKIKSVSRMRTMPRNEALQRNVETIKIAGAVEKGKIYDWPDFYAKIFYTRTRCTQNTIPNQSLFDQVINIALISCFTTYIIDEIGVSQRDQGINAMLVVLNTTVLQSIRQKTKLIYSYYTFLYIRNNIGSFLEFLRAWSKKEMLNRYIKSWCGDWLNLSSLSILQNLLLISRFARKVDRGNLRQKQFTV